MRFNVAAIDTLSTELLDAVLDRDILQSKLEALSAAADGYGINILPLVGRLPHRVLLTDSLAPALETYFGEGWNERDYRAGSVLKFGKTPVILEQQYASAEQFEDLEYYRSQAQYRLRWTAMLPFSSPDEAAVFVFHRRIEDGPFSAGEAKVLRGVQGKLMMLASTLSAQSKAHMLGVSDGFDMGNMAAVFFDYRGKVVHANAKAQTLLGVDLQLRDGRLRAAHPEDTRQLYDRLATVLSDGLSFHADVDSTVLIRRRDKYPLVIRLSRLPPMLKSMFSHAVAFAVIVDPDRREKILPAPLAVAFRLTQREAQIAIYVAEGMSLPRIGELLNIGHETARSHLQSIFRKTETRTQGELAALIGNLRFPQVN